MEYVCIEVYTYRDFTRAFLTSNQFFFLTSLASLGIGNPHTPNHD